MAVIPGTFTSQRDLDHLKEAVQQLGPLVDHIPWLRYPKALQIFNWILGLHWLWYTWKLFNIQTLQRYLSQNWGAGLGMLSLLPITFLFIWMTDVLPYSIYTLLKYRVFNTQYHGWCRTGPGLFWVFLALLLPVTLYIFLLYGLGVAVADLYFHARLIPSL